SAVAYHVPVTFLVLRNDEYAILKWFAMLGEIEDAPGLDLPALDCVALASGYGVAARQVTVPEALEQELSRAIASERPQLIEVPVAPGMALA
ncbi:MAG: thiamine pyrophosphate-dependent enzyme, partial [Solirubrobacteraceae bacterium]